MTKVCNERHAGSREEREVPARFGPCPNVSIPTEMVPTQAYEDPGDPEAGRDTARDFMLRHGG